MNDFDGPYYEANNSPFCAATGKITRLFKGGSAPKPRPVAAGSASETPVLVGQAQDDEYRQRQRRAARNQTVVASANEQTFGQRLQLG